MNRVPTLLVLLLAISATQEANAGTVFPFANEDNYRLPNDTIPSYYAVSLTTNVHTGETKFTGTVGITLSVVTTTSNIVVHARQLENFTATIIQKGLTAAVAQDLTWSYEEKREFLTFSKTGLTFTEGTTWLLTINYEGHLRTDKCGFYLSTFTDESGATKYLASTQFETLHARHAFPCYDEPSKRAEFTITIRHDPSYNAISNMPVDTTASSTGVTAFQITPKMSTYLIAFIVSDFESTSGELNGLRQRVLSRKDKQDQLEWALWCGLVVESSLAGYFGVPFALPKLDLAFIPGFSALGMENWGLAIYREQYMRWTKESSPINLKTNIASIIGHEYAHMWFGNLVSVKWWTYLWLKEGFATLFSYESIDISFPEWDTYQIYHVQEYNKALLNDAQRSAVPMTHYVQTPSEISKRYNTFSYAKSASVLFMFKNAWSNKVFQSGLNKYLTKNQYTSCDEWDLFAAFQEAANEHNLALPTSIDNIFSSWSHQAGYPLVTVTRNYDTGAITVRQERYLADKNSSNTATWYTPINFATASNPDYRNASASHYLLNVTETTITDVQVSAEGWLLANKQNAFYLRTLYDEQNYLLLADALNSEPWLIHPRNRAQLLYDAYIFVTTGRLEHRFLWNLLSYLKHEETYAPWSNANTILTVFDRYFRGDGSYFNFQIFVQRQIQPVFDKIGVNEIPGEHYLNNYLRIITVSLGCQVGYVDCYTRSSKKLSEFLFNGTAIEPTLRTEVYCAGLRSSSTEIFSRVKSDLLSSTDATDRSLFISSLGCSNKEAQLAEFLALSLDTANTLSYSERTSLLNSAYSKSEDGLTASLVFLETNWEAYGNLSETAKPLDKALRDIATYVVSDKQKTRLNNLVDVVKKNGAGHLQDDLNSVIDSRIQANIDWLDEHRDPTITWLEGHLADKNSGALTAPLATILISALALLLLRLF